MHDRQAGGRPVEWAPVRIGGHAVDPEVIRHGVAMAGAGTGAGGVELEIMVDPMTAHCGRCQTVQPVTSAVGLAVCPRCGGFDIELTGSEEASVEALRYKEAEWTPSSS